MYRYSQIHPHTTYTHSDTLWHTHMHAITAYTHTHTHTHTRTCTHTHTHTHSHIHTHTITHTHTYIHTQSHTHTRTHARTHTHRHQTRRLTCPTVTNCIHSNHELIYGFPQSSHDPALHTDSHTSSCCLATFAILRLLKYIRNT